MMRLTSERTQPFLDLLYRLLQEHPQGISEWDLVGELRRRRLAPFCAGALEDDLVLFQVHFLLFHLLYRLQGQLAQRGEEGLLVHCLKIRLTPSEAKPVGLEPQPFDGVRDYYLDWSNLESTGPEKVAQMLSQFWRDYQKHQSATEAYEALGLEPTAGLAEVKRRYRSLAHETHPDKGGDQDRFDRITKAKRSLLP
ncbi:MAG: hypothetical protein A2426_08525 [Candidatus Lambdaproteobacteria bacterium RIFOXYC1_FULL_56_13]|nr:MAG: hypothetical protein A2426_08525 [Candidatus Lambdaproteobacteria bacterium RIFOXYC1_FULL_56_13]